MVSLCYSICVAIYVTSCTQRSESVLSAFKWALGIPFRSSGLQSKLVSCLPGPHVRYCEQWHWLKPGRSLLIISGVLLASSLRSQGYAPPSYHRPRQRWQVSLRTLSFSSYLLNRRVFLKLSTYIALARNGSQTSLPTCPWLCLPAVEWKVLLWGRGNWQREEVLLAKNIICGNSINSTTHSTVPNRRDGNLNGKFFN